MRRPSKKTVLLVGAGLFVVGSIVSVEVTSQNFFCGSACHIMDPYYESWKTSSHHDVKCVECHIPPGAASFIEAKLNGLGQVVDDVLDRTSTKPSASVADFACQRSGCHGPAAGGNLDPDGDRPYRFKHEKHLHLEHKGVTIHCTTCHSHVKGDEHFVVNTNACVTCHLIERAPEPAGVIGSGAMRMGTIAFAVRSPSDAEDASEMDDGVTGVGDTGELTAPSGCEACHEAPQTPFEYRGQMIDHREYLRYGTRCESCHRSATARPEPIRDSACLSCHAFGVERALSTDEVHRVHSEGKHKVECFSCHGVTDHGIIESSESLASLDCASCHSGQHQVQVATFSSMEGRATAEAASMVSPMFLSHVDCNACHVEPRALDPDAPVKGTYLAATPSACDTCHKAGTGSQMVEMWQRDTRALFAQATKLLEAGQADGALSPEIRRLRDDARNLLDLVRVDGSWGVHNPKYTAHLLELASGNLLEARRLAERERGGAGGGGEKGER